MSQTFEKTLTTVDGVVTVTTTADAAPATVPAPDYEALYRESKAETARVNSLLTAARTSRPTASPNADKRPATSAEHVRRSLSPVAFLNLTHDDRLRSVHVDPASVTDDGLRKLFGKGTDGVAAGDLFKSDQLKYRTLKEAAKILGIFCA